MRVEPIFTDPMRYRLIGILGVSTNIYIGLPRSRYDSAHPSRNRLRRALSVGLTPKKVTVEAFEISQNRLRYSCSLHSVQGEGHSCDAQQNGAGSFR